MSKHTHAPSITDTTDTTHEGLLERCSSVQSTSDMFKTWAQFSNYLTFFKSIPEVAEKSHKDSMKKGESALWLDNGKSSKLIKLINMDTGRN